MKLKVKLPLIILVVLSVLLIIYASISYTGQMKLVDVTKRQQMGFIEKLIEQKFQFTPKSAMSRAKIIADMSTVKTLFRKGVDALGTDEETATRIALASEVSAAFKTQFKEASVLQMQFHIAPATSYLRLHAPDKFGDDLSGFRKTVLKCNREGKPSYGVEVGKGGIGLRGVVPVIDEQGQIGSFEIGLDFSPFFTPLQKLTQADFAVFLDKKSEQLPFASFKSIGYEVGDYLCLHSTNKDLLQGIAEKADFTSKNETKFDTKDIDGKTYGVGVAPLRDFSGSKIGVILFAKDFSEQIALVKSSLTQSLILLVVMLVVVTVLIIVLLNKLILNPMHDIAGKANEISGGNVNLSVKTNRKDEIGEISNSFERMRISLKKMFEEIE